MAIVKIFSGEYCYAEDVANSVASKMELNRIEDRLLNETSAKFNISSEKLLHSMHGPSSVMNKISRNREKNIAYLRRTLAEIISDDNQLLHGLEAQLLPDSIPHVLKVCIIANMEYRVTTASDQEKISKKAATKAIQKSDQSRHDWVQMLHGKSAWDKELYDMILPMQDLSVEEAIDLIIKGLNNETLKTTNVAKTAVADNILATQVNLELVLNGHDLDVVADEGKVTVLINKYMMRLEKYIVEIEGFVQKIGGVKEVHAKAGPRYTPPSINPMGDFKLPTKMLLVDDEKDFVHTLSERLLSRDLDTAVVYDGEEALSYVDKDDPEVMVLDLKMPGIDGLEVLRRVKKTRPHVEVIILTGHGSDPERDIALALGAFAYLQKPANIDQLAETMKAAYKKVRENKEQT
jgi:two-component system, OmpR family, response regulator CpxR